MNGPRSSYSCHSQQQHNQLILKCFSFSESGVPEDDYWNQSEDESSGMSSYGEEDTGDVSLSRKSSNTSQKSSGSTISATSSGVDTQNEIKEYMREMERQLADTHIADTLTNNNHTGSDGDDEFDDVEDFAPVKVDMQAVQDLVKTYTAQNGMPGPASSLLGSLGMKPKKV